MIPHDWPRLLNMPEIRNEPQMNALTSDGEMRQARHVFLYFFTLDCMACLEQIDEINDSVAAIIATYGVDSVAFYKVQGGREQFDEKFEVHTFPTVLYIKPESDEKVPAKRIVDSVVNDVKLGNFVMDCVEGNKSRVSEEWTKFVADFDKSKLTPEILLGELETAMEYIEILKDSLNEALEGMPEHYHHEDWHEEDEFVLETLISQQKALNEALEALKID